MLRLNPLSASSYDNKKSPPIASGDRGAFLAKPLKPRGRRVVRTRGPILEFTGEAIDALIRLAEELFASVPESQDFVGDLHSRQDRDLQRDSPLHIAGDLAHTFVEERGGLLDRPGVSRSRADTVLMIEDLDDCPGLFSHSVASIIQGTEKIMGDFRDLPLLPEAPATARITTWQSTRYSSLIWKSTIMLGFSPFFQGIPNRGGVKRLCASGLA